MQVAMYLINLYISGCRGKSMGFYSYGRIKLMAVMKGKWSHAFGDEMKLYFFNSLPDLKEMNTNKSLHVYAGSLFKLSYIDSRPIY